MSAARGAVGTHTVHRRLTSTQQARRARILATATALAARGGYDAVVMRDVAARARVSLATVYRYFSSKDHLLAEALVAWGGELGRNLRESRPRAANAADRVASVFRRMARGVAQQPQLGIALTTALLSRDPSAYANREGLTGMMREWILLALGDAEVPDRDGVIEVLQHVCFSCMITLANGQRTAEQVGEELERCTRVLLGTGPMTRQAVADSPADAAFRAEARAFLEKHARRRTGVDDWSRGPRVHTPETEREHFERCRAWQRALYDGGFAGLTWPRADGGRGASVAQALIFAEEQEAFDVTSGFLGASIDLVAPALLHHGSPAQRERYMRPLLRGDEVWCQLFSEPAAGSDLAGLRTRAERDGDAFVVSGQKLWTSSAQFCDFGILLARTNLSAPKHRGITFFLVDMRSRGIAVRPLPTSTGTRHFNEVFFDAVRVPADQVVGAVDAGWAVARETLAHESASIGSSAHGTGDAEALIALANARGHGADAHVRQEVAQVWIREQLLGLMRDRLQRAIRAGRMPDLDGSVLKIFWAESRVAKDEVGLRLLGADGLLAGPDAPDAGLWPEQVLDRYTGTIGGGTLDVHRNGIGERVLGLPREPRASAEGGRSEAKPSVEERPASAAGARSEAKPNVEERPASAAGARSEAKPSGGNRA